eukprot:TRINITY_DN6435_c0_g1_i2.p1 TRINITY_DN6435_c0_g1~~TRINITY_DN6435_c0_g1_i2.p1  ORF type:complete len:1368 (+),score=421.80 TRINITY_DN6435_c0_g1_i2:30-4133(+)
MSSKDRLRRASLGSKGDHSRLQETQQRLALSKKESPNSASESISKGEDTSPQSPQFKKHNVEEQVKPQFLKVKFPPDYPFEIKVVSLEPDCNVPQAVRAIQLAYKLPILATIGLYSPDLKQWLPEKTPLRDIEAVKREDVLEYRDKRNPISLGDPKLRRRTQSLTKKASSPFFQQWENTFKQSIKKTEETKRREDSLRNVLSLPEISEIESKLGDLAKPRHERLEKKRSHRRSLSQNSLSDKNALYDDLVQKLRQREDDAKMAAEIGKQLLERNHDLIDNIKIYEQRDKDYNQLKNNYSELEGEVVRITSRCMLLESQTEEAIATNQNLLKEIEELTQQKDHRHHQRTRSANFNFSAANELESVKRELATSQLMTESARKQTAKLRTENEQLTARVGELEDQLDALNKELENVEVLKSQVLFLKNKNRDLENSAEKFSDYEDYRECRPEDVLRQLNLVIARVSRFNVSQDEEFRLLSSSEKIIDKLKNASSRNEASVFKNLLVLLQNHVERGQTEISTTSKPQEQDISMICFMLTLLSLGKQEVYETKIQEMTIRNNEISEDAVENQNKYQNELRVRSKLEERRILELELKNTKISEDLQACQAHQKDRKELDDLHEKLRESEEVARVHGLHLESARSRIGGLEAELTQEKNRLAEERTQYARERSRLRSEVAGSIKNLESKRVHREKIILDKLEDSQKKLERLQNLLKEFEAHLRSKNLEVEEVRSSKQGLVQQVEELQKSKDRAEDSLRRNLTLLKITAEVADREPTSSPGTPNSSRKKKKKRKNSVDIRPVTEELQKEFDAIRGALQEKLAKVNKMTELSAALHARNEQLIAEIDQIKKEQVEIKPEPVKVAPPVIEIEENPGPEIENWMKSYVDFLNELLDRDTLAKQYLPLSYREFELQKTLKDGFLLCKLIDVAVPGTIDERVLKLKAQNQTDMEENHNLLTNSSFGIGISPKNIIYSDDLMKGNLPKIFSCIAELVEIISLSEVNVLRHPELHSIFVEEDMNLEAASKLLPEEILLRWFNYHLRKAKHPKQLRNFGADLQDSTAYGALLHRLDPNFPLDSLLSEKDPTRRGDIVTGYGRKFQCGGLITGKDIAEANEKANIVFTASIFNFDAGVEVEPQALLPIIKESTSLHIDDEGNREDREFRFWMNSLGVQVRSLNDMSDGILLLKVLDAISPSVVPWTKVNLQPGNAYKKIENCNLVITLCKKLNFPIVNIGGKDIHECNRKFLLSILWQCMRFHFFSILRNLRSEGKDITEADMLAWANSKIRNSGKGSSISSFKDSNLKDGRFLIDLISSIRPSAVNYDLVTPGSTDEERMLNAKYSISLARKLGCCIFLLWEDIVEVNSKMILMFVGSLMLLR